MSLNNNSCRSTLSYVLINFVKNYMIGLLSTRPLKKEILYSTFIVIPLFVMDLDWIWNKLTRCPWREWNVWDLLWEKRKWIWAFSPETCISLVNVIFFRKLIVAMYNGIVPSLVIHILLAVILRVFLAYLRIYVTLWNAVWTVSAAKIESIFRL